MILEEGLERARPPDGLTTSRQTQRVWRGNQPVFDRECLESFIQGSWTLSVHHEEQKKDSEESWKGLCCWLSMLWGYGFRDWMQTAALDGRVHPKSGTKQKNVRLCSEPEADMMGGNAVWEGSMRRVPARSMYFTRGSPPGWTVLMPRILPHRIKFTGDLRLMNCKRHGANGLSSAWMGRHWTSLVGSLPGSVGKLAWSNRRHATSHQYSNKRSLLLNRRSSEPKDAVSLPEECKRMYLAIKGAALIPQSYSLLL